MNSNQKKSDKKPVKNANVLETLKSDVGGSVASSIKEDLLKQMPGDVLEQLFGRQPTNRSGIIEVGEAIEMKDVMSGRADEERKAKEKVGKQLQFERTLREEITVEKDKKINELKIHLNAIMQEAVTLVETTQDLAEETQIATMQAPVEPGIYHVIFFQSLLEFIKSFRKKISDASVWLQSVNKRAQKKGFWGKVKKGGSSYLLSGEHYASRSAG